MHRESKKTRHQTIGLNFTNYYPIFKIFFTSRLGSKFATNLCLNIPPRFEHVATLPSEIWMQKKWHHSEIRIAINDESQGSIAKNLRCDGLLYYTFIIHSAGERIFKTGEYLAKLRAKSLTCVIYTIHLALLSSKMQILPNKSNNLCITNRNCY